MVLYGTDPVIVEYDPGTDIQIGTYSFLPVSDAVFRGMRDIPISAGFPEKRHFIMRRREPTIRSISGNRISTREELSDYIAADGKITVRYSGGK